MALAIWKIIILNPTLHLKQNQIPDQIGQMNKYFRRKSLKTMYSLTNTAKHTKKK
jgi:hypothetical protein